MPSITLSRDSSLLSGLLSSMGEGERLVTQADLDAQYSKIQDLMIQVKAEIIVEQRRMSAELGSKGPVAPVKRHERVSYESVTSATRSHHPDPKLLSSKSRSWLSRQTSISVNSSYEAYALEAEACACRSKEAKDINSIKFRNPSLFAHEAIGADTEEENNEKKKNSHTTGELSESKISKASKSKFTAEGVQGATLVKGKTRASSMRKTQSFLSDPPSTISDVPRECTVRGLTKIVAKSPIFDVVCGVVICFNAVLICIETEHLAQTGNDSSVIERMQFILNTWYTCELILRIVADGVVFFRGKDKLWNLADTALVLTAILDFFLSTINSRGVQAARILRVLRFFRILRTLRIIRQMKYVREFRKMVCSLTASMPTLFTSLIMVFGVMYSFALWFTQAAAYYRIDNDDSSSIMAEMDNYYSSFGRTIYTLFAAISGGYSWHELLDPWVDSESHVSVLAFFLYISVCVFGLMNIVTSVFVESAMHATKTFQDLLLDEKKKEQELYTLHMQRIFHHIDQDGGGTISFKEMKNFLEDDISELAQYLEALGISSADVWVLFKLLDTDCSGVIDIDEFVEGCTRLRGGARSFDLHCILYENRAMLKYQSEFMEFVENRFDLIDGHFFELVSHIDKKMSRAYSILGKSPRENPISNGVPYTPSSPRGITPHPSSRVYDMSPVMSPTEKVVLSPRQFPSALRLGVTKTRKAPPMPPIQPLQPLPEPYMSQTEKRNDSRAESVSEIFSVPF